MTHVEGSILSLGACMMCITFVEDLMLHIKYISSEYCRFSRKKWRKSDSLEILTQQHNMKLAVESVEN
jgi:hypothetical protein